LLNAVRLRALLNVVRLQRRKRMQAYEDFAINYSGSFPAALADAQAQYKAALSAINSKYNTSLTA
jgi:hypothetical protein